MFKVLVLGDTGVGKTCLAARFCGGTFPMDTQSTVGVDFLTCEISFQEIGLSPDHAVLKTGFNRISTAGEGSAGNSTSPLTGAPGSRVARRFATCDEMEFMSQSPAFPEPPAACSTTSSHPSATRSSGSSTLVSLVKEDEEEGRGDRNCRKRATRSTATNSGYQAQQQHHDTNRTDGVKENRKRNSSSHSREQKDNVGGKHDYHGKKNKKTSHGEEEEEKKGEVFINSKTDSNEGVQVQLWDTAGEERFGALTSTLFRGAHGAMIVYDVSRRSTLQKALAFATRVRTLCGEEVPMILVGNKSDLEHVRAVSRLDADEAAKALSVSHLDASAFENKNVLLAFRLLIRQVVCKQCRFVDPLGRVEKVDVSTAETTTAARGKEEEGTTGCSSKNGETTGVRPFALTYSGTVIPRNEGEDEGDEKRRRGFLRFCTMV